MIVYAVSGDGDGTGYHGSAKAALASARERSKGGPGTGEEPTEITVERCTLVPITKEIVIKLLNYGGGFVEDSVVIARFKEGKKVQA